MNKQNNLNIAKFFHNIGCKRLRNPCSTLYELDFIFSFRKKTFIYKIEIKQYKYINIINNS